MRDELRDGDDGSLALAEERVEPCSRVLVGTMCACASMAILGASSSSSSWSSVVVLPSSVRRVAGAVGLEELHDGAGGTSICSSILRATPARRHAGESVRHLGLPDSQGRSTDPYWISQSDSYLAS
jgi:hypothetical protein